MGRELRRVPKDWVHPKDKDGDLQPVLDMRYDEYKKNKELWANGTHPDQLDPKYAEDARECKTYASWAGSLYPKRYYIPYERKDCTHYQLYENTSEGTPLSPVFATMKGVAQYATEHEGGTYADWIRVLKTSLKAKDKKIATLK